jgi:Outer membrane protein beta-barrel domain
MKKISIIFLLLTSVHFTNAQISFGAKAGVNFADFGGENANGLSGKIGFNIGGLANISLTEKLKVQPEILYSAEGTKSSAAKFNPNLINIPVLLQYSLYKGLYAETGPQFGIITSFKVKPNDSGSSIDVKDSYKSSNFSWGIGFGYQTNNGLGMNARYNLGLASIAKGSGDLKMNNITLGVFYTFGKANTKK